MSHAPVFWITDVLMVAGAFFYVRRVQFSLGVNRIVKFLLSINLCIVAYFVVSQIVLLSNPMFDLPSSPNSSSQLDTLEFGLLTELLFVIIPAMFNIYFILGICSMFERRLPN